MGHQRHASGRILHTASALSAAGALLLGAVGCGGGTSSPTRSSQAAAGTTTSTRTTPTTAPKRSPITHVVWIVMENKGYEQVIGSPEAPYVDGLAGSYGLATGMTAVSHPSLPNYIAMTSGSPQGTTDDAGPSAHALGAESIFGQTHGDWRALQESTSAASTGPRVGPPRPASEPAIPTPMRRAR